MNNQHVSPNFIELLDADIERPIMVRASAIEEIQETFAGAPARLELPTVKIRLSSGAMHNIVGETAKTLFERMTAALGGLPSVRCDMLPEPMRAYHAPKPATQATEQETTRASTRPASRSKMVSDDE